MTPSTPTDEHFEGFATVMKYARLACNDRGMGMCVFGPPSVCAAVAKEVFAGKPGKPHTIKTFTDKPTNLKKRVAPENPEAEINPEAEVLPDEADQTQIATQLTELDTQMTEIDTTEAEWQPVRHQRPEAEPQAEGEAEGQPRPEMQPAADPQPEMEAQPEEEAQQLEDETELDLQMPEAEPEAQPEAEPEPEPAEAQPEPEAQPELLPETEPADVEDESDAETELGPEAEAAAMARSTPRKRRASSVDYDLLGLEEDASQGTISAKRRQLYVSPATGGRHFAAVQAAFERMLGADGAGTEDAALKLIEEVRSLQSVFGMPALHLDACESDMQQVVYLSGLLAAQGTSFEFECGSNPTFEHPEGTRWFVELSKLFANERFGPGGSPALELHHLQRIQPARFVNGGPITILMQLSTAGGPLDKSVFGFRVLAALAGVDESTRIFDPYVAAFNRASHTQRTAKMIGELPPKYASARRFELACADAYAAADVWSPMGVLS